jgi:hypothetical protein
MMPKSDNVLEQELRHHMELQCLPSENKHCCSSSNTDVVDDVGSTTIERIGIFRPPGRLGRIVEDYVTKYVLPNGSTTTTDNDEQSTTATTTTIVAHPNHDTIQHTNSNNNNNNNNNHNSNDEWMTYTKIIRPIVMPILLEVLDLILLATTTTTDQDMDVNRDVHVFVDRITVPDVITTLRILMQYHCYIGQVASVSASAYATSDFHVPILTISLHHLLTYPQEVNDSLIQFLNLHYHHSKLDRTERMDSYAATVFQLYDTCTTVLHHIITKYDQNKITVTAGGTTKLSFNDLVKRTIQEELHHGYCSHDLHAISTPSFSSSTSSTSTSKDTSTVHHFRFDDTLISTNDGSIITRMTPSRTTEMIRSIFVENSLVNTCKKYPNSLLCSIG